ncbi:PrsW family intramembrane metalloprotease [Leptothermofonsia sichuanensis E412]|uniref:PrsW family glutamic-type intramembrane protease n=1 Tax=Leptothermofonsia sichuanensis TaxID=2917832 RepID=UPI001CA778CF|nr:PrsW family glutamic-type intramembrane protease [Leptothermofonsia sichuanensis]QZZ18847.1 PrsW family intramembrane metalloprotease [Leptothermofonsia sichuanensis E412]
MTGQARTIAFLRQLAQPNLPEQTYPRYPLSVTESVSLGRDPRCQIVLDPLIYRSVSRRHAEVSPILSFSNAAGGDRFWQVCDLGSANGTYVNGQRLKGCQVLQPGDCIMLGQDGPRFVFECETSMEPLPEVPPVKGARLPNLPLHRSSLRPTQPPPARTPYHHESDQVSWTQLFPIFSTGRHLRAKAYLVPGIATVTFVVSLFLSVGDPGLFNMLLAAYLAGAAYYFIYQLCGKNKPWWLLLASAATTALLLVSPVLDLFIYVFRTVLPGSLPGHDASVSIPVLLIKMFFGAGLMEELLKAIPILIACVLGMGLRSPLRERLGVREPLDGILLGSASAVGFTLVETLGQYVPEIYKATLTAGEGAAQLASLQLLIPRVMGSVAGHMAYSGYLGYFIGLSVLRPRRRWRILLVGYLTAAILHTLWNVTGTISPVLLAVVGVMSYAFLGAAILKARELSPTRSQNFATRFYQ